MSWLKKGSSGARSSSLVTPCGCSVFLSVRFPGGVGFSPCAAKHHHHHICSDDVCKRESFGFGSTLRNWKNAVRYFETVGRVQTENFSPPSPDGS